MNQPTPKVTEHDIERIVKHDFPQESYGNVMALLNEYGKIECQREPHRVRLAALKIAKQYENWLT